ncbi:MAG TPA: molybdenum ABC transporter ATP-binding protein [Gammaproteobacteria bacterium]|nr:molybdenum ABC transporter ATP-binding protein [Gammaproteobacteria bacterium]
MLEFGARCRLGAFALDASFSAGAGVTALFGRSGAGKSTVLNLIAGLAQPGAGRIAVDGRTLYDSRSGVDLPPYRRRIGYVFQEGRLLPHFTVRRNLLYGRLFAGGREAMLGFEQAVELLGLGGLLERRPGALSGGEKQRVAIGRALLANPEVLLLDEPLASLDAPRKAEILYYVERLRDEIHVPIVYVSHSLDEVVRLADTLVLLSEGRVLASGPVAEMTSRSDLRPYLGRHEGGAVIEARVMAQDLDSGLARLEFGGGALEVPDVEALVGERVRIRVRAKDVSIALSRPSGLSIRNMLAGTVVDLHREEGPSLDVSLDIGGTALIARITRKSAAELGLRRGLEVFAMIKSVSIDRRSVGYA